MGVGRAAGARAVGVRPYLLLGVGVLSVGAAAILIREAHAPTLVIAFWRTVLGGSALALVVAARQRLGPRSAGGADARPPPGIPRGEHLRRAVIAGLLLGVHFWSWIASLEKTSVAASVVLVCTQPIFVALLAHVVLRERTPRLGLVGIAVAFAGAALIAKDATGGSDDLGGDALALVGAVAIAVYVLVGRRSAGKVDVMAYSATVSLVAAASLAVPLVLSSASPAAALPPTPSSWFWVCSLALGPQLIGHTALNAALARLPAPVVSGSILGEPVISTALAWLVLDEIPGVFTLAGSAVVLTGLVVLLWATRPAPARAPAPPP